MVNQNVNERNLELAYLYLRNRFVSCFVFLFTFRVLKQNEIL